MMTRPYRSKLLSLFDGSGGFPLAASLCGIEPVAASEIEPFCISVTKKNFPNMKHLGNVIDIHGDQIEPVDLITFGSPCQDLSIAGARAGIEGSRSSLFFEAIRIIREMREATNGIYPRFALWENVPGAFSSHGGRDFHAVLNEFLHIVNDSAEIPSAGKDGWPSADLYVGDGWSIAYRVFDAQYWGVPQRRRRIYLVADFRGESAGEILFKRPGLRGDFKKGFRSWQGSAGTAEEGAHPAGFGTDGYNGAVAEVAATLGVNCGMSTGRNGVMVLNDQGGQFMDVSEDVTGTLRSQMSGTLAVSQDQYLFAVENHPADSRCDIDDSGTVQTLTSRMGTGGNNVPMVMFSKSGWARSSDDATTWNESTVTNTLNTFDVGEVRTSEVIAYCNWDGSQIAPTITAHNANGAQRMPDKDRFNAVIGFDGAAFNQGANAKYNPSYTENQAQALLARGPGGVAYSVDCRNASEDEVNGSLQARACGNLNSNNVCRQGYIVRRLTPLECCRLQGFPDGWGDVTPKDDMPDEEYEFWLKIRGKKCTKEQMVKWYKKLHTDAAEYKMWGNGIALPTALYVMQGIAEQLEKETCVPDMPPVVTND